MRAPPYRHPAPLPPTTKRATSHTGPHPSSPCISKKSKRTIARWLSAKSWKGDPDGTLVFTGFFAANVGTFVMISLPDLIFSRSIFLHLARLYQLPVADDLGNSSPSPSPSWSFLPTKGPAQGAGIRTLFREGVDKLYLPVVVEALPELRHISVLDLSEL
ncbi:hypothetical protein BC834DRAFT_898531, partial [Gloeopeniophorella convolvens]